MNPDTNDNTTELMNKFSKKLKTRRILLISKYKDITQSPSSVQDEIYTIQTLLNILEVSESDYSTPKEKSSNGIEINKTLIEEYENNIKKFNIFKEMNSSDVSEQDEIDYIKKEEAAKQAKEPINQYKLRQKLIEEHFENIDLAPQSVIDEYKNLGILINQNESSKNLEKDFEIAGDGSKISIRDVKIYNALLKINKTLQIINARHLEKKEKPTDEKIDKLIDDQINSVPSDTEALKQKLIENELKIAALTKSSKMISNIDKTINVNTEIKNAISSESEKKQEIEIPSHVEEFVKEEKIKQDTKISEELDTRYQNIDEPEELDQYIENNEEIESKENQEKEEIKEEIESEEDNIVEQIYQEHLKAEQEKNQNHNKQEKNKTGLEALADEYGIIVAKSRSDLEKKEKDNKSIKENKKSQNTEKVVMAVQTLIKGQEKISISPEYTKNSEKPESLKKFEKENHINTKPVQTITKSDLEKIYGIRKNEPGFYEAIEIVEEALKEKK